MLINDQVLIADILATSGSLCGILMVRGRPAGRNESASDNEVGVEAGRKTVNRQQMNFSFSRFPPTHHA